jgi:hypothetical protein
LTGLPRDAAHGIGSQIGGGRGPIKDRLADRAHGRVVGREEGDLRTDAFVEAREAALQLLELVADEPPPARRLQAAVGLPGAGRGKADRVALGQSLAALSSLLRDLGALTADADERALANADLRKKLERLLRTFDGDRVLRAFAAVDKAVDALGRNASPKIVADWLVFQI